MAELKIKADSGGGTVSLKGPATTTSNAAVQLTLPQNDGNANQLLKTDGSGNLSWVDDTDTTNTNASNLSSGTLPAARIEDDSIVEAKLDIHAAPSGTDKFLGYTSNGMEWTAIPAGGIEEAMQWHMTTTFGGDANPITNWAVTTNGLTNPLKTGDSAAGVTESSGKFFFPATGFWLVTLNATTRGIDGTRYFTFEIQTSGNNESSWETVARGRQFIYDGGTDNEHFSNHHCAAIIDVTSLTGGTNNVVKFSVDTENNSTNMKTMGDSLNYTYATFIKLAET